MLPVNQLSQLQDDHRQPAAQGPACLREVSLGEHSGRQCQQWPHDEQQHGQGASSQVGPVQSTSQAGRGVLQGQSAAAATWVWLAARDVPSGSEILAVLVLQQQQQAQALQESAPDPTSPSAAYALMSSSTIGISFMSAQS